MRLLLRVTSRHRTHMGTRRDRPSSGYRMHDGRVATTGRDSCRHLSLLLGHVLLESRLSLFRWQHPQLLEHLLVHRLHVLHLHLLLLLLSCCSSCSLVSLHLRRIHHLAAATRLLLLLLHRVHVLLLLLHHSRMLLHAGRE
ncbi:hypothetical protein PRIPAC_93920, partial [Pristionchus pacificus]